MKCDFCKQEMTAETTTSCKLVDIPLTDAKPIPYDASGGKPERCRDCNVSSGGFHHPGCCIERCPTCNGQLISCGCMDDGA